MQCAVAIEGTCLDIMSHQYIPHVGDRVQARSKGNVGERHVGTYTDYWFPGQITKVLVYLFTSNYCESESLLVYLHECNKYI